MSGLFSESGAVPAAVEPAAPAAAEPVVDPLAAGVAAGAVADPEPQSAPTGPSLDQRERDLELENLRSQYEQLSTAYSQISQQPAGQQDTKADAFDPYQLVDEYGSIRPETLMQLLDARNSALLQSLEQRFEALQSPIEQQQRAATEQRYVSMVDGMVADNLSRHGDLSPKGREFMEGRAAQILPDLNSRFGTNPDGSTKPNVLEMAIEKAAGEVRELLGTAGTAGAAEQAQRLATLAGASGEPGGAAGAVAGTPQFKTSREVVEFYARGGPGFAAATANGQ